MKISPARTSAFDILLRIEREKAYSSVLLPMFEADLSTVDRSLCHELTLGTLRRQMFLDAIIDAFASGKKIDVEIRIALRMALYQLIYLDKIPQFSAINESVNLVQRAKKTSAKGFVNAILRRATREKPEFSFASAIERISVETSHPAWLIEKWTEQFGSQQAAAISTANNEIPDTAFRVLGQPAEDVQMLVDSATPSSYAAGCYIASKREDRLLDLAAKGRIYLQDEASQLVAQAVDVHQNGKILDVCAAPGGKTGLIARRDAIKSAMIVAGDLHWPRVEYLRDNCRRQGAESVKVVQYDAEKSLPFADGFFDVVLVDAPCSGTGTIRHNPEIRYFLRPSDFPVLASKQLSILVNASKLVRTGGTVIYSTCSLEKDENEDVCGKFAAQCVEFQTAKPNVAEIFMTRDGFARTWPHRDSMDGFFIAAFRRTETGI